MTESYNTDLLMQVREQIVTEPETHRQGVWAVAQSDPRKGGDCGTAYCVAGWAAVLDGQQLDWDEIGNGEWDASLIVGGALISDHAQDALGLTYTEQCQLFRGDNTRPEVLAMLDKLITAGKNGERVHGDLLP